MTRGVSMNDLNSCGTTGGCPRSARRLLTTPPHVLAAGVQRAGRGPFKASSQPSISAVAPAPDETRCTRTNAQPSEVAASLLLKDAARLVNRSNFSGEE